MKKQTDFELNFDDGDVDFFSDIVPDASLAADYHVKEKEIVESTEKDNSESPWLWNGEPIEKVPDNMECMVYLITCKTDGTRYIGFKMLVSHRTRVVKGKKKREKIESDWRTYWSSSTNIASAVEFLGTGNFIREIICFCPQKGLGKYMELQEQIDRRVLTENTHGYFNGIVNVRLGASVVKRFNEVIWHTKPLLGDTLAQEINSKITPP